MEGSTTKQMAKRGNQGMVEEEEELTLEWYQTVVGDKFTEDDWSLLSSECRTKKDLQTLSSSSVWAGFPLSGFLVKARLEEAVRRDSQQVPNPQTGGSDQISLNLRTFTSNVPPVGAIDTFRAMDVDTVLALDPELYFHVTRVVGQAQKRRRLNTEVEEMENPRSQGNTFQASIRVKEGIQDCIRRLQNEVNKNNPIDLRSQPTTTTTTTNTTTNTTTSNATTTTTTTTQQSPQHPPPTTTTNNNRPTNSPGSDEWELLSSALN